jgi:organic hydroperoxide reductase OsmC/OhrA
VSEHAAKISWKHSTPTFDYRTYSRNHIWTFPNGLSIDVSAAPAFRGDRNLIDPEAAFVASLASCHLLTFLAICAKKGLVVESYEDDAIGYLEKNEQGLYVITRVELRPKTAFQSGTTVSSEMLGELHHLAHQGCFLANSVKTQIETILPDS